MRHCSQAGGSNQCGGGGPTYDSCCEFIVKQLIDLQTELYRGRGRPKVAVYRVWTATLPDRGCMDKQILCEYWQWRFSIVVLYCIYTLLVLLVNTWRYSNSGTRWACHTAPISPLQWMLNNMYYSYLSYSQIRNSVCWTLMELNVTEKKDSVELKRERNRVLITYCLVNTILLNSGATYKWYIENDVVECRWGIESLK